MKNILFLDDLEERHLFAEQFLKGERYWEEGDLIWRACNFKTAIELIKSMYFDLLSLDHDLGLGRTGSDLTYWITQEFQGRKPSFDKVIIHSYNVPGGKIMQADLGSMGITAPHLPFNIIND
jgi:hypothetical protein